VATQRATTIRPGSARVALLDRSEAAALWLDPRWVAVAHGLVLLVLGFVHLAFESRFGALNLDGERNVPAVYSAGLWACVALLAALLGNREEGLPARVWWAFSLCVLLVSLDELGSIHERLERITGVDWQVLYSPLALVAAVLLVFVGRRLRELSTAFGLFVAGALCGAASQVIEAVEYGENDRRVAAFHELVLGEELLEMTAAVLIGLGLLQALRVVSRQARA
jgi:hypothetical protein